MARTDISVHLREEDKVEVTWDESSGVQWVYITLGDTRVTIFPGHEEGSFTLEDIIRALAQGHPSDDDV